MGRFDYVKYDDKSAKLQAEFKQKFEEIMALIVANIFDGDMTRQAIYSLDGAYAFIGKAIRDDQRLRDKQTGGNDQSPLQEERSDS